MNTSKDKIFDVGTGTPSFLSCGTTLSLEFDHIPKKLSSTLLGYSTDDYLIIKIPASWNVAMVKPHLYKGNRIIVRFIEGGVVYGFETDILGIMLDGAKLIITGYPRTVSKYELREKKRYGCIIPGKLYKDDVEDHYPAVMIDVSEKGCCINIKSQVDHPLPEFKIDERVSFHFILPGSEGKLLLTGEVKNLQQDNTKLSLGIKYDEVTSELRDILHNYIVFMGEAV